MAIAWSAESLRSDIGAETDRDGPGAYAGPYRLARDLTLLAAASAGVAAIDTAFADPSDADGLRAEALAARRDGLCRQNGDRPGSGGHYRRCIPVASTAARRAVAAEISR